MIKPLVYAWISFKREGSKYKGSHRFFCKKHKKMLNGAHCYCCFVFNLKKTCATSRPLCKKENGVVPQIRPPSQCIRMKRKAFLSLIKKYRALAKKSLRSNK